MYITWIPRSWPNVHVWINTDHCQSMLWSTLAGIKHVKRDWLKFLSNDRHWQVFWIRPMPWFQSVEHSLWKWIFPLQFPYFAIIAVHWDSADRYCSQYHSTGRTILYLQPIDKLTSQCEIRTLWTELTTNYWGLSFDMSTGYIDRSKASWIWQCEVMKYARGHNQYFFTPHQLHQGREFMHTLCKAVTSHIEKS